MYMQNFKNKLLFKKYYDTQLNLICLELQKHEIYGIDRGPVKLKRKWNMWA